MKKFPSPPLASKIYELRKKKKLTQSGLAKLVGVSGGAISQFESGINLPSISTQQKLSEVLDFDLTVFPHTNVWPPEELDKYETVIFIPISEYPWLENFGKWLKEWEKQDIEGLDEEGELFARLTTTHGIEVLRLPNINYECAFVVEIKGNSMAPRYPHRARYVAMRIDDLKYSTGVHLFCFHAKSLLVRRIISNKEGVLTLKADATGEESTLQLDEINKLREEGLFMALKLGQAVHMPPEE